MKDSIYYRKAYCTFFVLSVFVSLTAYSATAVHAVNGLVGWACYNDLGLNGTTGGGNGSVVHAKTVSELQNYAKASAPYVIIIDNNLEGSAVIDINSNKTLLGAGSGVTLNKICLNVNGKQNIILRNLTITKGAPDAISIRNTHHVWVDHCDLSDSSDGLLDFTIGSSYMTVSWCRFHDHNKVSLANSGTSHFEDIGKERVTYHHNWYNSTVQRNPRIGYGLGHVFNCYYSSITSYCIGFFNEARVLAENNYFQSCRNPFNQSYSSESYSAFYGHCLSRGNLFVSCSGDTKGTGSGFEPALFYNYAFLLEKADSIPGRVRNGSGPKAGLSDDILPLPGNGAIDVTDSLLTWTCLENVTRWQLRLGTSPDSLNLCVEPSTRSYRAGNLEAGTTYFWKVTALRKDSSVVESPLWRFTTAPATTSKPSPSDKETAARLRYATSAKSTAPTLLYWTPAYKATAYNVYFDTVPTFSEKKSTSKECSFTPGSLAYGRNYYWRVDAVHADGSITEGALWTFRSAICKVVEGVTECEKMVLNCKAFKENCKAWFKPSGDFVVSGEAGPGTMSCVWAGPAATCKLTVTYFDEDDDRNYYHIYVNEQQVGSFYTSLDNNKLTDKSFSGVSLKPGDEIRIEFYEDHNDDKEQCRTDKLTIAIEALALEHNQAVVFEPGEPLELRVYSLTGILLSSRSVTADDHGSYHPANEGKAGLCIYTLTDRQGNSLTLRGRY